MDLHTIASARHAYGRVADFDWSYCCISRVQGGSHAAMALNNEALEANRQLDLGRPDIDERLAVSAWEDTVELFVPLSG